MNNFILKNIIKIFEIYYLRKNKLWSYLINLNKSN